MRNVNSGRGSTTLEPFYIIYSKGKGDIGFSPVLVSPPWRGLKRTFAKQLNAINITDEQVKTLQKGEAVNLDGTVYKVIAAPKV